MKRFFVASSVVEYLNLVFCFYFLLPHSYQLAPLPFLHSHGPTGSPGLFCRLPDDFRSLYEKASPVNHQYELFAAVILAYCAAHQPVDPAKGETFFKTLDKEAFKDPGQLLKKIDAASQRMWTSALTLEDCGPEHERELCFLINHAIRQDHPALVAPAVQLARNINQLCITRRKKVLLLPPNGLCFRGSSLPDAHRSFFTGPGKKYRAAGFLATDPSN